jgi:hypothetical protein
MLLTDGISLYLDHPLSAEGEARLIAAIDAWLAEERAAQREAACDHRLCMAYRLECFRRAP